MEKIYIETSKFLFWEIAIIVVLLAIAALVYFPLHRYRKKTKWQEDFYLHFDDIAKNYDYYLVNRFSFRNRTGKMENIDHILLADKYIYLIQVAYYDGDLTGNFFDPSLVHCQKNGKRGYTPNLALSIREKLEEFACATGLSPELMIGVIVVNENCRVGIRNDSKQLYIIQIDKFKKLINAIESRKVSNLDPEAERKAVNIIVKMNRNKKKKNETKSVG